MSSLMSLPFTYVSVMSLQCLSLSVSQSISQSLCVCCLVSICGSGWDNWDSRNSRSLAVSIASLLKNVIYFNNLSTEMDEHEFFKQTVQHLARCLSNLNPTPWEKVRRITTLHTNNYFVMFSFIIIDVFSYFYLLCILTVVSVGYFLVIAY